MDWTAVHLSRVWNKDQVFWIQDLDSVALVCVNAVHEVIPTEVLEILERKLPFSLCSTRNNLSVLEHNRDASAGAICRIIEKGKQRPG